MSQWPSNTYSPVLLWGEPRRTPSPICTWTQLPKDGPRGGGSGSWGLGCLRSSVSVLWRQKDVEGTCSFCLSISQVLTYQRLAMATKVSPCFVFCLLFSSVQLRKDGDFIVLTGVQRDLLFVTRENTKDWCLLTPEHIHGSFNQK